MNQEIVKAAEGLLFISESESPMEYITLPSDKNLLGQLRSLSTHKDGKVETQTLPYFFRNMTRDLEGSDPAVTEKFRQLQQVLERNLTDLHVYRIGEVQVDAFIIGKLPDGSYAGLKTHLIET